ncbi:MAG: tRNA pseudouridine(55) synthase TruB [Clostridia bacterium]|nr:tRNA pseudouridine(55) synthase TruB [Clostridia bacterium]
MNGYLLINKPKGPTSHDVIFRVRRIAKTKKVGHTGTLDPMATGLMVVCIGDATKAADYITNGNKAYLATMKLGFVSDTLDSTGDVTPLPKQKIPEDTIREVFSSFVGEYEQTPPMYSAKKIGGKKLYELARKGQIVARKSVTVSILQLDIHSIENDIITFYVECSKGTYIRSLIDDIGKKLGYGAIMTDLKRVKSGQFSLDSSQCYTLEELEAMDSVEPLLLPVDTAFLNYPKYVASPHFEKLIKNGIMVDLKRLGLSHETENQKRFRVYNQNDQFFAVMEIYEQEFLKLKTTFFHNGEKNE